MRRSFFAAAAVLAVSLWAEEIEINGSFKTEKDAKIPSGWSVTPAGQKPIPCKLEIANPDKDGNSVFRITAPKGNPLTRIIGNNINVNGGDIVKISGEAKGKGKFGIGWYSFAGASGGPFATISYVIDNSEEWKSFQFSGKAADGEKLALKRIRPLIFTVGEAEVSLRNLKLQIEKK